MANYKPESKIGMEVTSRYWAYDKDGNFKGEVKLNARRKKYYEDEKGMTFTRPKGSIF